MSRRTKPGYGRMWGPVFWNYALSRAAFFLDNGGYELRWYGITIFRTKWGVGFVRRVTKP